MAVKRRPSRPDFVPQLTARGRARQTVLELCDGQRSLAQIEQEVLARHADLFGDRAAAATFVTEVVVGYTK